MIDRVEIKSMAKEQIKGNIGILFLIALIIAVISFVSSIILGFIPVIGTAGSICISAGFSLSTIIIYLNLTFGAKPSLDYIAYGFNDLWSAVKVSFFTGLFTVLWSMLFIIPGIIKAISYSQAMYILAENKGMPALEAISKSKEMMKGHKMEYFVLGLSFLGWTYLGIFTLGIAYIWVIPYMNATYANYYNKLKGNTANTYAEATYVE